MINKENIMANTAKLWSLVSKNLGPQNKRSNLLNFEIKRLRWITSRINVKPIWRIRKHRRVLWWNHQQGIVCVLIGADCKKKKNKRQNKTGIWCNYNYCNNIKYACNNNNVIHQHLPLDETHLDVVRGLI